MREILSQAYLFIVSLGGPGLFFVALADSSFLSLPESNDILIVVLSTGQGWTMMSYYVVMTIMGSVCGCALLYWVGRRGGRFLHRRVGEEKLADMETLYRRWGIWAILIPCVLPPPTPFKVFVLSAGVFRIRFLRFLLAVAIGRSFRYFMWGILGVIYGQAAKSFIDRNLPMVGLVLFVVFTAIVASYTVAWFRTKRKSPGPEVA